MYVRKQFYLQPSEPACTLCQRSCLRLLHVKILYLRRKSKKVSAEVLHWSSNSSSIEFITFRKIIEKEEMRSELAMRVKE